MRTSDFDFELPEELIAQRPPEQRGDSRLMIIDRASGNITHHHFSDFPSFINDDDLLILNNTRVVPARFYSNDGKMEILRLDSIGEKVWQCLVKPGKKFKIGRTMEIGDATGTVIDILESGDRLIEWDRLPSDDNSGHLALPPYIRRDDELSDRERYQTVYAQDKGAIAAPTAGLHFTDEMLASLPHDFVTLHVGLGTFRPVAVDDVTDHVMHSEQFSITPDTAERINQCKGRTIAIGTTSVRVLETCAQRGGSPLKPMIGDTDIFIYPPFSFGATDALLTNFHLPKSTLLMLISAFADWDLMRHAYETAVEERYRFFSYGDCMLIL
ncbi:MAG: tRNA preQ1(34) S-adenosylmethionine ribosyltransferase-isomerase QueA [Verrucomicrobiota bacterium]